MLFQQKKIARSFRRKWLFYGMITIFSYFSQFFSKMAFFLKTNVMIGTFYVQTRSILSKKTPILTPIFSGKIFLKSNWFPRIM
jgi:hypothetical protein